MLNSLLILALLNDTVLYQSYKYEILLIRVEEEHI